MFDPENIQEDEDVKDIGDSENCKPLNVKDMKEIEEDYGEGIIHKRTQTFTLISKKQSKEYKKRRQYLFENNRLKRPTDIIVFTDSYSFSATSFFIKGLQEIGGAIIVGYYGNPKVPGKFDASQSTSGDGYFDNTDIENNFNEVGFQSIGITVIESFNYTCQNKNPIPREFLVKPVDERVNISELYDDSKYDKFIEKAKEIFKKYNEEKKCNKDNPYLLFEPNDKECYKIENDSYAHGGYECNKDTGEWSNLCKPFYCDIGYYFDVVRGKCIKDLVDTQNVNGIKIIVIKLAHIHLFFLLIIKKYIIVKMEKIVYMEPLVMGQLLEVAMIFIFLIIAIQIIQMKIWVVLTKMMENYIH